MEYEEFLRKKQIKEVKAGFTPIFVPDYLFDFQKALLVWSLEIGKSCIWAECGMGKTIVALVWAENIIRKVPNAKVLIFTPLAVAQQYKREADRFGITANIVKDGKLNNGINITNYEKIHYFESSDFVGVVADEGSIIKNADGKRRKQITAFLSEIPYRLICTATPSPNDFMELGTSSEALGNMSRNQMLGMFFTNTGESTQKWELKGHAKKRFWQWIATWARAVRRPSDLGFDDTKFILPELRIHKHVITGGATDGFFVKEAKTMDEHRAENRRTLKERCEKIASLIPKDGSVLIFCHLNPEGDLLEKLIPDSVQVAGRHSDEEKEQRLNDFALGRERILISKPKVAGLGLNFQVAHTVFYFPSFSHEFFYQSIRRVWRFGQNKPVDCHLISTEVGRRVLEIMLRKERQSTELYESVVKYMGEVIKQKDGNSGKKSLVIPSWFR